MFRRNLAWLVFDQPAGYNAQFKKHKTTKISLITDIKGKQ